MAIPDKAAVKLTRSSQAQDTLNESDLEGGNFRAVFSASDVQFTALKDYIKFIQDGTDTSSVETAIDAL